MMDLIRASKSRFAALFAYRKAPRRLLGAVSEQRHLSAMASAKAIGVTTDDNFLRQLRVNQDRLMGDIHHTCQWGKGERWGE